MVDTTYTATAIDGTTYTQSAGMDGATTTDNVAELAGQAAASAAAAIVAKMEWRGDWLTSTAFALNNVVYEGGSSYICIVAHTSGTFATDLTAVKWELVAQKGADGAGGGSGDLLAANNLSDLAAAGTARTNLGLGTAATTAAADYATAAQGTLADDAAPLASPTFTGVAAAPTATAGTNTTQLATTAFVLANVGSGGGDVLAANNLSDLANAGTARTNLGVAIGSDVQAYAAVLANTTASYTSAEETKLNDIETLADVTDSTNVTAAGAVMDSELASIADVKALDQSVVSGATPTFGVANMTLADTSLVVVDTTNMQTFADGVDSALLRARGTGFTSSYTTATAAAGGTTFAQPAVNGEIYSDEGYFVISYAGATGITVATLTSPSTYVYIDNAGNLQQQVTIPTRQDWSRKMFTMRIAVDTAAETILGFEFLANPIGHYANSDRDIFTALLAQGVPFKGGQIITGRAGDLGFDVGAGTIMEYGGTGDINNPNLLSLDAASNVTYSLLSRTAIVGDQTNLVKSWDNAGSITDLGSGTFVAHRLYRFSNGNFAIQYGQGNYANLVLARAGLLIEDYVLNERLRNATFFGWWIIGETATNTGGTTLTEFREYTIGVQGGSSSGLAGCLLRGNNLSDLLDVSSAQVNLDLEPGVDVQAYDADTLKSDATANLTAAYTTAIDPDGTITTGTYTPTTATGSNSKWVTNGGASTLAPPATATDTVTHLSLFIINNASAGAITTSGFTKVAGDAFTTTDTHKFSCTIQVTDIGGTEYSTLVVLAMQ